MTQIPVRMYMYVFVHKRTAKRPESECRYVLCSISGVSLLSLSPPTHVVVARALHDSESGRWLTGYVCIVHTCTSHTKTWYAEQTWPVLKKTSVE